MKIEKYVVVLVAENGDKKHLKLSVSRDENIVEIHLPEGGAVGGGNIYLIGEEIAKQPLYDSKYNYKVRFRANKHIEMALCCGGKTYVGGTGKTPKHREIKALILGYEDALENAVKSSFFDSENVDKKQHQNNDAKNQFCNAVCGCNGSEIMEINNEPEGLDDCVFVAVENHKNIEGEQGYKNEQNSMVENEMKSHDYQEQISSEDIMQNRGLNEDIKQVNLDNEKHRISAFGSAVDFAKNDRDCQCLKGEENKIFSFDTVRFDGNNFYLSVKPQLDEIFVCYPEDETLNLTVPNSRWVRIDTNDGYYVVGLVLDGDDVSYICYGVPSTDKNTPPAEIKDLAVWLSTAENDGKGYWIIYQDALTGKCLK